MIKVNLSLRRGFTIKIPVIMNNDMVSHLKSQGRTGGGSTFKWFRCTTYGKKHLGKCHAGINRCFVCGKGGHKMKYLPTHTSKGKETTQTHYDS